MLSLERGPQELTIRSETGVVGVRVLGWTGAGEGVASVELCSERITKQSVSGARVEVEVRLQPRE